MKKKLEMHLLNNEKLHKVSGGTPPLNPCRMRGDVIDQVCDIVSDTIYKWCHLTETTCKGTFTFVCGINDVGCTNYRSRPIN